MWPFKKKPKLTFAEYAATRPLAPCGDQIKHVFGEVNGLRCYVCEAIEKAEQEDRFAEKIAAAVVRRMRADKV